MIVDFLCGCAVDVERERSYAVFVQTCDAHNGKNLRDQLAMAALPGILAARVTLMNADLGTDLNQDSIAEEAYELADAMLEERKK